MAKIQNTKRRTRGIYISKENERKEQRMGVHRKGRKIERRLIRLCKAHALLGRCGRRKCVDTREKPRTKKRKSEGKGEIERRV